MSKIFDNKQNIKQQYPARSNPPGPVRPVYIPLKEAPKILNQENIKKIFETSLIGNISEIKLMISKTNNPLNIKNENGQSLIHYIIENETLHDENDKLEIIKFLLNQGASISYDKYNVCPLHLACKNQYKEIVKYLLDSSDVNACDSNGMNALHYLVQGNLKQSSNEKKNGMIIEKNINKDIISEELKNISVKILEIFNNSNFNKHFSNIRDILLKLNDHYPGIYDTSKLIEEIGKKLIEDKNSNEWKQIEIERLINNYTTGIKIEMKNKFSNVLSIIENDDIFKEVGMNDEEFIKKNLIVEEKDNDIVKGKNIDINSVLQKMKDQISNVKTEINEIKNSIIYDEKVFTDALNKLYSSSVQDTQKKSKNELLNEKLITEEKIKEQTEKIGELKKKLNTNKNNDSNYDDSKLLKQIEDLQDRLNINQLKLENYGEYDKLIKEKIKEQINLKLNQELSDLYYPNLDKKGKISTKIILSYSTEYTYTKKILLWIDEILKHINNVKNNIKDMMNNLDLLNIYETIVIEILTSFFNIAQCCVELTKVSEELNKLNTYLTNILEHEFEYLNKNFKFVVPVLFAKGNLTHFKIPRLCYEKIENINNKYLNKIIQLINNESYNKSIMALNTTGTNNYDNIFNIRLQSVMTLPKYEKYLKEITNKTLDEQRKYIYETYFFVINSKYLPKYLCNKKENGRKGFLMNIMYDEDTNNNTILDTDKVMLEYPDKSDKQDDNFDELNDSNISIVDTYKIGKIAKIIGNTNTKSIYINTGEKLNEYMNSLKLYLIKKIIEEMTQNNDIQKNFIYDLKQLDTYLDVKYDTLFISYVIKIANNIIIKFIENSIYSSINKHINLLSDKIKLKNKKIKVYPIELNYNIGLNDLYEDLIEKFGNIENQTLYPQNLIEEETNPILNKKIPIYDTSYKITKTEKNYKYFEIDCEIIDLLYNNLININKKDVTGSSPLFYAIEINDHNLIQKLLSKPIISVIEPSIENNYGITPYKHFINLYKMHMEQFINTGSNTMSSIINKITKPILDDIKEKMQLNIKYKNNIVRYLDIIFPQLLIMYNNMLYFYAQSYSNNWSYENNEDLKKLLFNSDLYDIQYKLPILKIFDANLLKNSIKFNYIVESNNKNDKKKQNKIKQKENMLNVLESLKKELDMYKKYVNDYLSELGKLSSVVTIQDYYEDIKNKIKSLVQTSASELSKYEPFKKYSKKIYETVEKYKEYDDSNSHKLLVSPEGILVVGYFKILDLYRSTIDGLQDILEVAINKKTNYDSYNNLTDKIKYYENQYNLFINMINKIKYYNNITKQIEIKINYIVLKKNILDNEIISLQNINKKSTIGIGKKYKQTEKTIKNNIDDLHFENKELLRNNVSEQHNDIFNNISKMHNQIVDDVICNKTICNDYILYNELWKKFINNDIYLDNISNIHLKIILYENELITNMNKITFETHANAKEIHNKFNILNQFYEKILVNTINSSNELPYYYNYKENYYLAETLDIITHIVKHALCANLYYTVIKILTKYLIELNRSFMKKNEDLKTDIYDKIQKSQLIKEIHNYILLTMPKLLVKKILDIYENDYEETTLDVNKIFEKILNIIISSSEFELSADSTLVINLRGIIFDYYKDLFQLVIPKMKIFIDDYNKFILNESRFVKNAMLINEHICNLQS